jgi:hypothetical protein
VAVGVEILDVKEEEEGERRGRAAWRLEKMGERGRESDLKTVHAGLKPSTFECT